MSVFLPNKIWKKVLSTNHRIVMELHEKTPPLSRDHLSSRNGYEKAIGPRELNFAN